MLQRCCLVCRTTISLTPCPGCKLAYLCIKHHDGQHRGPRHAERCQALQDARKDLAHEEARLVEESRTSEDPEHAGWVVSPAANPFRVPPRIFEDGRGYFWDILGTRYYIIARLTFAEALQELGTLDAVEAAVHEYKAILRLCRGDALDVGHRLLPQLLRVGRVQECFDLITTWMADSVEGRDEDVSVLLPGHTFTYMVVGATRAPVEDPCDENSQHADLFEDPREALRLAESVFDISKLVTALLVKVTLWLNLDEIDQATALPGYLGRAIPLEILQIIQLQVARPAVLRRPEMVSDIRNGRRLEPRAHVLWGQVGQVAGAITRAQGGEDFWDMFSIIRDWVNGGTPPSPGYDDGDTPGCAAFRRNCPFLLDNPRVIWALDVALRDMSTDTSDGSTDGSPAPASAASDGDNNT